jgi:hypothetical protein
MLKLAHPECSLLLRTAGTDYTVPTLQAASVISRSLIEESGLGCSEWDGAVVLNETTKEVVAVLSYNGRAWAPGKTFEGRVLAGELEFERS